MSSLEKKIVLSFSILSIAFLIAMVLTYLQINLLTEKSRLIQHNLQPSIQSNLSLVNALQASSLAVRDWVHKADQPSELKNKASWSLIDKSILRLKNYSNKWQDSENRHRLNLIQEWLDTLKPLHLSVFEKTLDTTSKMNLDEIIQQDNLIKENILVNLRKISDPQIWEMERTFQEEEQLEEQLSISAFSFLFLSILFSAIISFFIIGNIIRPLNSTIQLADSISKGNYTIDEKQFSRKEKLDLALRKMTKDLFEKDQQNKIQKDELAKFNDDLTNLNDQLKTTNDELSQFSYRTSHDLKSPLISIKCFADFILEEVEDQNYNEIKDYASRISQSVVTLENLITDILDLTKADLNEFEIMPFDLFDLIEEITQNLKDVYLEQKVTVMNEVSKDISINSSRTRISQILNNIISNGIKYYDKEKEHPFVKVIAEITEKEATIKILDNGLGISKQYQDQVFDMFKRFHTNVAPGSGLGMYIVKKHVDKLNGEIKFTSCSEGTEFVLKIPI